MYVYIYIYIVIYLVMSLFIYVYVCVCVCVCVYVYVYVYVYVFMYVFIYVFMFRSICICLSAYLCHCHMGCVSISTNHWVCDTCRNMHTRKFNQQPTTPMSPSNTPHPHPPQVGVNTHTHQWQQLPGATRAYQTHEHNYKCQGVRFVSHKPPLSFEEGVQLYGHMPARTLPQIGSNTKVNQNPT